MILAKRHREESILDGKPPYDTRPHGGEERHHIPEMLDLPSPVVEEFGRRASESFFAETTATTIDATQSPLKCPEVVPVDLPSLDTFPSFPQHRDRPIKDLWIRLKSRPPPPGDSLPHIEEGAVVEGRRVALTEFGDGIDQHRLIPVRRKAACHGTEELVIDTKHLFADFTTHHSQKRAKALHRRPHPVHSTIRVDRLITQQCDRVIDHLASDSPESIRDIFILLELETHEENLPIRHGHKCTDYVT